MTGQGQRTQNMSKYNYSIIILEYYNSRIENSIIKTFDLNIEEAFD